MKTKIIIALTACLFAAGSIINMHLAQNDHNTDISLADISVMAQADGESGGGNCGGAYAAYQWDPPSIWGGNSYFNRCAPMCPTEKGKNPVYQIC